MTGTDDDARADDHAWGSFLRWLVGAALVFALAAFAFNVLVDPYGSNPLRLPFQRPLMDINQRFMYPQVIRSHIFDSAVFGSSTVRLLKPSELDADFGGRFANFGMNAATPYEQSQIATLFLKDTPKVGTVVWGLDTSWCDADADSPAKRLTERPFPPWLYGDNPWMALPHLFNMRTVEISARVVLNKLGLMKERLPRDGYRVFTPPERLYDLARARTHLYGGPKRPATATTPAPPPPAAERASWRYPGLGWLAATLDHLPRGARLIVLFPPLHVASQPVPASIAADMDGQCKRRVASIVKAHHGITVDFRFPSPITEKDAHYWDPLHYRVPIASRIVADLQEAASGKAGNADYKVVQAGP